MSIDQYEFIECPGANGITIPIVKKTTGEEDDTTGVRVPDWMVKIDGAQTSSYINGYTAYTELFGWYAESSRHVKGDSANGLCPSSTLWHSDIFLVMQNGFQNAHINKSVADGTITPNITIIRLSRINNKVEVIQTLVFSSCHWVGIHAYLDWSIARFTACIRSNTVQGFDQKEGGGGSFGSASCIVDYTQNTVT